MAFPATNVRLVYIPVSLLAIRRDLNPSSKSSRQGTIRNSAQLQKLTSVGLQNFRNRASAAKIRRPGLIRGFKKITFFQVAASVVISIKIFTVFASRSFHKIKRITVGVSALSYPSLVIRWDEYQTRVTYSPVRVSTRITSPSLTNCGH
jgi:hypothetical protein